jgi:lysozyme
MNRDTLMARLKIEEGDRLTAYLDTMGILTVGVGHNCVAKPVEGVEKPGDTITPEQRDQLLSDDIDEAAAELTEHLPWWTDLDDARQNVLLDMAFNCGIHTLLQFKNTLAAVKAGSYMLAASGMKNSQWASQVKGRAVFLENAMVTGVYA